MFPPKTTKPLQAQMLGKANKNCSATLYRTQLKPNLLWGAMSSIRRALLTMGVLFLASCAGFNPNPGERTVDIAWNKGEFSKAFKIAKERAELGEPWAQLRLGIFYENGWGTTKDLNSAEEWYRRASQQEASGDWADGKLVGAAGELGYFNQNSDSLIAKSNLAQLYLQSNQNLEEALALISEVIEKSGGETVFFCCEFAGGMYFTQEKFAGIKGKIEESLGE